MPLDVAKYIIREAICHGCLTFMTAENIREGMESDGFTDTPQCQIPPIGSNGKNCPCSYCLVKMMCEEACIPFQVYKEGYYMKRNRPLPK